MSKWQLIVEQLAINCQEIKEWVLKLMVNSEKEHRMKSSALLGVANDNVGESIVYQSSNHAVIMWQSLYNIQYSYLMVQCVV